MIPLRDENPSRTTPWITYVLVVANVVVYVYQIQVQLQGGPQAYASFVTGYGLVPRLLTSPGLWAEATLPAPLTVLTSMFVHGSLFHLLGNMLYLWIFGDNIEDSMGHARFLGFYLLCGVGAALAQVLVVPGSMVPMVGASGAIAGVLGAYLILYPRAQVLTLVFLFFFIRVMYLPAVFLLGLWFLIQVMSATGGSGAGVAWYAHIGGFVAGILTIGMFIRESRRPRSEIF